MKNFHFDGGSLLDSQQHNEDYLRIHFMSTAKLASGSAVYNLSEIMTLATLRNIKLGVPVFCGCTFPYSKSSFSKALSDHQPGL